MEKSLYINSLLTGLLIGLSPNSQSLKDQETNSNNSLFSQTSLTSRLENNPPEVFLEQAYMDKGINVYASFGDKEGRLSHFEVTIIPNIGDIVRKKFCLGKSHNGVNRENCEVNHNEDSKNFYEFRDVYSTPTTNYFKTQAKKLNNKELALVPVVNLPLKIKVECFDKDGKSAVDSIKVFDKIDI